MTRFSDPFSCRHIGTLESNSIYLSPPLSLFPSKHLRRFEEAECNFGIELVLGSCNSSAFIIWVKSISTDLRFASDS